MNKIPIGNTLQVRWRVKHNGQAESLEGLDLALVMTTPSGQKQAMAFAVSDTNLVTVNFEGKDQKHTGNYRLDLYENRGVNNQRRIDSTPAFVLVAHTAEAHRESDPNLEVYTVDLTADIEIGYPSNAVLFTPQELTAGQQQTARANINAKKGGYSRIEKLHDYIHEIWYDGADYSFADLLPHTPLGACTSIRKGKFFARNLDWQYSECCEFFVHTPAANGRHAVDGFGGNIPALTKSVVESGAWNAAYNWLPLSIADGHNDAGLCCSMNVVPTKTAPNTYEKTTGTNPTKPTLNGLMIVRYILDNHTDALAAAQDIANNWNVVMPHTETFDEELHFLIADKTKTIVLEFVGNEAVIIQKADQEGYITNFRLNGVTWPNYDTIETFGQGVERYGLINQVITTPDDILLAIVAIMRLWYTNAYTLEGDNAWRTEFAGLQDELTVQAAYGTPSVYDDTLAAAHQAYLDRTRDGETWQTTHSVVYDIETGECVFVTQQDTSTFTQRNMALPIDAYTKAETDALLDGKQDNISDLASIRDGASAGATALQPDDLPTFGNIVTHNADEFLPSSTEIPSKTSDLANDSDYTTKSYVDGELDKKVDKVAGKGLSSLADASVANDKLTIIKMDGTSIVFQGGGGVPEAPTDGDTYGRKNGAWVQLEGGGAPTGAVLYSQGQTLTDDEKRQALVNLGVDLDRMTSEAYIGTDKYVGKLTNGHYFSQSAKPAVATIAELYAVPYTLTSFQNLCAYSSIARVTSAAWITDRVTNLISAFMNNPVIEHIDISGWDTSNATTMKWMFSNCANLSCVNVSGINTANVTDMYQMFYKCSSLTELDVSGWNTENVTSMYELFGECKSLAHLDVSGWNTGNVTDMQDLFYLCNSLTELDVSGWNTGKVMSMAHTFRTCSGINTLDVSGWNTSNVTKMGYMFSGCISLTSLDLSGWNTSKVTDMNAMFYNCSSLTTLIGAHTLQEVLDGLGALNGTKVALSLSQSTLLERASLRAVINGLADLTGQTNQTLTLGNTLKAKLTDADKQIAASKNWTIA